MGTPNLNVGYVAAGQTQKEVTINAAFDQLDKAANQTVAVDCTAAGTVAVASATYVNAGCLKLTGAPASPFTVTVPDTKRIFVVHNDSGQQATVQSVAGGTTTIVPDGYLGWFVNQGSDAVCVVLSSASGGGGALALLSDVTLTGLADNDELYFDTGVSKWKNARKKHVVSANALTGVLTNSQVLLLHRLDIACTIPANFADFRDSSSQAGGSAVATASTEVKVQKAANATPNTFSDVGTITFGAGTVTPTFATSGGSAVAFAKGDVLRLIGPASADATFADFYATLVMYET